MVCLSQLLSPSAQSSSSDMLPMLLAERLIHQFNFYLGFEMRQGMRYGNELYELTYEFNAHSRLEAYQIACELLEHGIPDVITASIDDRYKVWISLRSPAYQRWTQFKISIASLTKLATDEVPGIYSGSY